jgi:hypothetical protein
MVTVIILSVLSIVNSVFVIKLSIIIRISANQKMSDKFLTTLSNYKYDPKPITCKYSAVVILMRENPHLAFENKFEILYILRQFRERDMWSGQVGFPGISLSIV